MDIGAIRTDIAAILGDLGYSAWAYVPSSVPQYPAAVVSVPTEVNYAETLKTGVVSFLVTVVFSAADPKDCQTRLDNALGTTDDTSVFNALNRAAGTHWTAIRCVSAQEPRYVKDGNAQVLAADLAVEVHVLK